MMTIREYKRAESLEEAWQLNQKKPNRILGGMIWLKMETINVGTAIDLSGLGLDAIEETEDSFSIGAMVTLRQLEQHPGLAAYTHGAMREAVRHIVGVQLRNLATVGGSIYSRFGFSDVLTMFLAMDCDVELYKGGILPLQEYAQRPYDRDILVRLIRPAAEAVGFPAELAPLSLVRLVSSSAATGLLTDLFAKYGPDSFLGRTASVMMSCTETVFYTMSLYFLSVGIRKTRYTLPCALLANLVGIFAAVALVRLVF